MVIVFPNQEAVTPAGRPVAEPIPVAPVVVKVIDGERVVFTHSVGLLDAGEILCGVELMIETWSKAAPEEFVNVHWKTFVPEPRLDTVVL